MVEANVSLANGELGKTVLLDNRAVVVTSPRYGVFVPEISDPDRYFLVKNAEIDTAKAISNLVNKTASPSVVAFGSGKSLDTAKYSAFLSKRPYIALPACLSTNCFFTDKSTLFKNGTKYTLDSKLPDAVIFDWNIISKNEFMNVSGAVELLSSSSALMDWVLAQESNNEMVEESAYTVASEIVSEAEVLLAKKDLDSLKRQAVLLKVSGDLVVKYGSGRPVSGSEHIISSKIEGFYGCPHGVSLSIAIPLALKLQENLGYTTIQNQSIFMDLTLNNPFKPYIKARMQKERIIELASEIKPRKDRYTMIDQVRRTQILTASRDVINDIFN